MVAHATQVWAVYDLYGCTGNLIDSEPMLDTWARSESEALSNGYHQLATWSFGRWVTKFQLQEVINRHRLVANRRGQRPWWLAPPDPIDDLIAAKLPAAVSEPPPRRSRQELLFGPDSMYKLMY